jgi:hypothetical protein
MRDQRCASFRAMVVLVDLKDWARVEVIGIDLEPGEPVVVEGNRSPLDGTPSSRSRPVWESPRAGRI